MKKIYELKQVLKEKAANLKDAKKRLKEEQRNGSGYKASLMQAGLVSLKRDYRHHHVAYCELRGRTREQIEKPRPTTEALSEYQLDAIKAEYAEEHYEMSA